MRPTILRVAAAVACVAAAAFLVLLAVDARAWSSRVPADDLRFRDNPLAQGLWHPRELTPFRLDRAVLGLDDDLLYRRAMRAFRNGRPREQLYSPDVTTRRIQAQIALEKFLETATDPERRSQAANLLGVLGFAAATNDVAQRITFLNNAIASFRQAIALDPSNDDALFNLEYALGQLKETAEQQAGPQTRVGQHGAGGLRDTGHGY